MKNEISFEIKKEIGVIESYPTGWTKEINLVAWNGNPAKYDIRDWDPDHEHMSRGITLSEKEMAKLTELVKEKMPEIKDVMAKEHSKVKSEMGIER